MVFLATQQHLLPDLQGLLGQLSGVRLLISACQVCLDIFRPRTSWTRWYQQQSVMYSQMILHPARKSRFVPSCGWDANPGCKSCKTFDVLKEAGDVIYLAVFLCHTFFLWIMIESIETISSHPRCRHSSVGCVDALWRNIWLPLV